MRIHFLGIKGSGIAGVANLASKMGYEVSGCDLNNGGHDVAHLLKADLAIVTPAVFYQSAKHPEVIEAQKRGIIMTWQKFLGSILLKNKKVIAIAGTHGKSTTTAMAAKLLIDNGFDPIAVIGAKVSEWGGSSRFGKGEYAIIEADEFNDNFLNYSPSIAIINNIEFDHPDYFKNESQVRNSFEKFKKRLVGPKILITQKDSLGKKFNLKIWGEHNQKNANMVYLLGKKLGIAEDKIISSIEGFKGVERRMEFLGKTSNGVSVYDDYAHHPTAIKATLLGLRQKYPKKTIWAIDEPHGFARTRALLSLYKGVFDDADKVVIGPIFKARDQNEYGITPRVVAEATNHKNAQGLATINDIEKLIRNESKSGDIILVMGAGESNLWAKKLLKI